MWLLQDEMRQGLSYFHETIFEGLPRFLRRIDTALKNIGQPMLPLDHCLFKFGSWCASFSQPSTCVVMVDAHLCLSSVLRQAARALFLSPSTLSEMFDHLRCGTRSAAQQGFACCSQSACQAHVICCGLLRRSRLRLSALCGMHHINGHLAVWQDGR